MSLSRSHGSEAGTTLIELLVTVVIMGVAFVTILGGIATAILGSEYQRNQTTAAAVLTTAAERVKALAYDDDCSVSYTLPDGLVPTGFTVTGPTVVGFWNGSDQYVSACTVDNGLQLIELSVTSDRRPAPESIQIVKRRP